MTLADRVLPGVVRQHYLRRYAVVALFVIAGGFALAVAASNALLVAAYFSVGFAAVSVTTGRHTVRAMTDLRDRAAAFDNADQLEPEDIETDIEIGRDDEIGRLYGSFADMSRAFQKKLRTVERARERAYEERQDLEKAREEATAAKQRAEDLNAHLERKAADYERVMERAADGDLTQRMDPDSESEPMAAIGETFNEMMTDLEQTMAGTIEFARDVTSETDDISVSASEINRTSDTVSKSVQEIADDANEQRETLAKTSDEVGDVSATVQEIAASADEVASMSNAAAEYGEEASEYATEAVDQMDQMQTTAEETIERVEQLDQEIEQISEIVDLITDIADQTNILALNASIEAERAGGDGAGFTVVANEVKELAEETNEATENVRARIQQVQQTTDGVVEDMQEMDAQVSEGGETVQQALDALNEIVDRVQEADSGIQSINEATDEQARSTQEIVAMIDDVSDISQETADRASDTAAAAEEQTASITQVNDSVQSLSDRAEALNEVLAQFSVQGGGDVALDSAGPTTDTATASPQATELDSRAPSTPAETDATRTESAETGPGAPDASAEAATADETPAVDEVEMGDESVTEAAKGSENGDDEEMSGLDIEDDKLPHVTLDEATPENARDLFE